MRNLIPMALVAGLAPPTSHPGAKLAAPAPATMSKTASSQKRDACSQTWQDQKKHVGARKAFMQACIAKG